MIVQVKGFSADEALRKGGYTKRIMANATDYIRKVAQDVRFHAKPHSKKKFDLHVDIYTDGDNHFSPYLPNTVKEELKRIKEKVSKK